MQGSFLAGLRLSPHRATGGAPHFLDDSTYFSADSVKNKVLRSSSLNGDKSRDRQEMCSLRLQASQVLVPIPKETEHVEL